MAVRVFDQAEPQPPRLTVVEPAPLRRQDVRRSRHHIMMIAAGALTVPFVVALLLVGLTH